MATALLFKTTQMPRVFAMFMPLEVAMREARIIARYDGIAFVAVAQGNGHSFERLRKGGLFAKEPEVYDEKEV